MITRVYRALIALLGAFLFSACGTPTVVRYDYPPGGPLAEGQLPFPDQNPRKLAIFLDGTANNYRTRTNVRRLFEIVANQERPDIVAYYQEGVGGLVQRLISSPASFGSLLGTGIGKDVRQAFQFLAENYRAGDENGRSQDAGDEVYIFGFSRGAYTARALAGMLDLYGGVPDLTPCRPCRKGSDGPYCRVGTRLSCNKTAPGANKEPYQRRRTVLGYYTSLQALGRDCGSEDDKTEACAKAKRRVEERRSKARPLKIHTMGLWDTVRSLGPEAFVCGLFKGQDPNEKNHRYHRDELYGNVERAFHALALDERRDCYYPLLLPLAKNNGSTRIHEEVWFVGDHSNIGGGHGDDKQLSGITLNWMIDHLSGSGLLPDGLSGYMHENAMGEVFDLTEGFFKVLGKRPRDEALDRLPNDGKPKLHASVVERLLSTKRCAGVRQYSPRPIVKYLKARGAGINERALRDNFEIVGTASWSSQRTAYGCLPEMRAADPADQ